MVCSSVSALPPNWMGNPKLPPPFLKQSRGILKSDPPRPLHCRSPFPSFLYNLFVTILGVLVFALSHFPFFFNFPLVSSFIFY